MNNQYVSKEALRKCKKRAMMTADEQEAIRSKDRERKKRKVKEETNRWTTCKTIGISM